MKYDSKNQLLFGKKPLTNLVKKWPGPIYVYSKAMIEDRIRVFMKEVSLAIGKRPLVHYAMKANSHPVILQLMKKNKIGADVVSLGELKKALKARIAAKDILYSGVGKTDSEIQLAIKKSIGQMNVESLPELSRIIRHAEKLKKHVQIGLRVNPEVNPVTHPYIATGFKENKFGIEFSAVKEAMDLLIKTKYVHFQGFSLHIGSQIFDFQALSEAIDKTLEYETILKKKFGIQVKAIDVGGGVGVRYDQEDPASDLETLKSFCEVLHRKLFGYQGGVQFEPGRFLVARAGILLTQIQYVKYTQHKNFIICDSGMNHLLRPALYQAQHRVSPIVLKESMPAAAFADKPSASARGFVDKSAYDIVGPICESSDVILKDCPITAPAEYDILAIHDVGAYGFSMASEYNSFALPKEIFV